MMMGIFIVYNYSRNNLIQHTQCGHKHTEKSHGNIYRQRSPQCGHEVWLSKVLICENFCENVVKRASS